MSSFFSFLTRALGLVGLLAASLFIAVVTYAGVVWLIEPAGMFTLLPDDGFVVAKAVGAGLVGGGVAFFWLLWIDDGVSGHRDSGDFAGSGLLGALGDMFDSFDD